jgi:uncharacterized protein
MAVDALIRWLDHRPAAARRSSAFAAPFDPADFSPALCTRLLILQPTPFCNLDCDYCYLPDRNSTARMSLATVRLAAQRLLADKLAGDELTVVWHAGEPLTLPAAWYDDAIAEIHQVLGQHCTVSHSIQTNGTLIDDQWCALIRRHGIRVGVSVDGPAELHDAHRRTRDGKGTHARVLRGMACLREHGIEFHAIAVVSPATFAQPDAFFDFFEAQGIQDVGCNFDEAEGPHAASSLAGHEAAHAAFVGRLLERSSLPGSRVRIRELAIALRLIAQPLPRLRWRGRHWPENGQTLPFALLSVAHNGDFSTFSPELLGQPSAEFGDFVFGNVARGGYLDGAASEGFRRAWSAIVRGVRECEATCAHFGYCGGGAPANKLYENGDLGSGETLYCRTMLKRPFDAVLSQLEKQQQGNCSASPAAACGPEREVAKQ